jgi:hypothetical protein
MASQPRLATTEFRTLLDELLAEASREGLEQWIRARGEALPSPERQSFLDGFAACLRQKRVTAPAPRNLLTDIDAFLGDLATGAFYVEEEWDEYGQDVTGQDDWVEPMDDLFAEATALARAGDWATATEALRRLLMAFQLEEEEGVFGGEESPTSQVQTDLTQATLQYLRGVLETAPPTQRVENLIRAVGGLYFLPKGLTLAALGQPHPSGSSDAPALADLLIPLLQTDGTQEAPDWDPRQTWLPEALVLQGGPPALLAFLRKVGYQNRGAVRTYLHGAVPAGDWVGIAEVATRARGLETDSAIRTWLLPLAVEGARRTGNPEQALALLEAGWRERSGTAELLAWLGEPGSPLWPARLEAALADPPVPARGGSTFRWRFLLGSWDHLLNEARKPFEPWAGMESRRWAFLVLALASLEERKPSASTQLGQAWAKLSRIHPQHIWGMETLLPDSIPNLGLGDLIHWKVRRDPLDTSSWAGIRRQLGAIAQGWATDVLKVSQRGGYLEAARWLAVAVEVHRICEEHHQAETLPLSILQAYPRHRAFRQDWESLRTI